MSWQANVSYKLGDIVIHEGLTYKCILAHNSHTAWAPSIFTHSIWQPIGASAPQAPTTPVIPTPPIIVTPTPVIPAPPIIATPTPQTPVTNGRNLKELLGGKRPIGAYFESWAMPWTSNGSNNTLANIKHANIVYISFVSPNCTYKRGQNTWGGTGLSFSSDFDVIKTSIAVLRTRGVVVMLSVGGATYPFDSNYNADGAANLVNDLGLNGIDIDWENHEQKAHFGKYISETRRSLGENLAVSAATFSVGAYGEGAFANALPPSAYTGMSISGLKSNGHQLDWLNLMTYDASDVFDPLKAYDAHRSYFKGPLLIGAEVPPEAWGGHVINLDKVKSYVNHVKKDASNVGGLFVWAYFKQGTPSCSDILSTAIAAFGSIVFSPPAVPVAPVTPPIPVPVTPVPTVDLVSKTVLGFQFFQDTKPQWARIDNVTIGESELYRYNSFDGPVIGNVLDSAFADDKVVLVLYEWSTGKAYTKTGFNLSDASDSKSNPGFTTFVIKNRVTSSMLSQIIPIQQQSPVITPPSQNLLGKDILGYTVIQDTKDRWLKLDNVTMGDTFNYQSYNSSNIGDLLDQVIGDPNVAVLLYNWKTGDAYAKTGFDINNSNDTKVNLDFTSFIVKDFKAPTGISNVISSNSFVKWQNGQFTLNGSKFIPVGYNAYWFGYGEKYNYHTKPQIEEMFIIAKNMSATAIRSHTLGFSNGSPNSLTPITSTGFNNAAWDSIDYSFSMAKKYGIKLIIPLCDGYEYYHGSVGFYTKNRGVDKAKFWTDRNVINDFKNYITGYLNHVNKYTEVAIKDAPEVFLIELGNELGNIRPGAGSNSIPTEGWLREISSHIKSIDKNHLVLNSSDESLGKCGDFNVSSIDVHRAHFYEFDKRRIEYGANEAKKIGKPYLITEYSSHFGQDWFNYLESNKDIKGSMVWSFYPHVGGYRSGAKIPHNDGFTLYYPEDTEKLLRLTNHFRKMQSKPTINSLII